MDNKIRIVWFFADGFSEYNSSHFRLTIFFNALKKAGHSVKSMHIKNWLDDTADARFACLTSDIIIIQRVMVQESIERSAFWIARGKKVLVDFDDAYDLIGPENPAYQFWGEGRVKIQTSGGNFYRDMVPHPVEQFKTALSSITGGLVPSKNLQKDWGRYGNMYYLPNYLNSARYRKPKKKKNSDILIGWGGSMSHLTSFEKSGCAEGLAQLLIERDDVKMLLVGDKRVLPLIPAPSNKIIFKPYVMWFDWPDVLTYFDIGIAPLAEPYDCRRSRLKVMEYICMEIPYVATMSRVYSDFGDIGGSGKYVDQGNIDTCENPSPERWYSYLKEVVNEYKYFKEKAIEKSIEYRPVYDVDLAIDEIIAVFEDILNG